MNLLEKVLKMPGVSNAVFSKIPEALGLFTGFLDKIQLQDNEVFATFSIFNYQGKLMCVITCNDKDLIPLRTLHTFSFEDIAEKPEKIVDIEKSLREKGYLIKEIKEA